MSINTSLEMKIISPQVGKNISLKKCSGEIAEITLFFALWNIDVRMQNV